MADNDDLMLEVTASTDKADTALKKLFSTLDEFQEHINKIAPSLAKFTAKLDSIASSSKALSMLKGITEGTSRTALSAKNAESKMALYQARIDRANTSMERSRVQSEKLSNALKKVSEAEQIAAKNNSAFSMPAHEFAQKFNMSKGNEGVNLTPDLPTDTYEAKPVPGHTKLASEILPNEENASVHINTVQAQSALSEVQAYIDRLTPSISHMSSEAQGKFNALASSLTRVSQQIDNQRAIYHQLSSAATQAASATGEGGSAYLRLEKRMLSADSAIDRLIAKQEELKSQMAGIPSAANNASSAMLRLGSSAESASSKSSSGFSKTLGMMEKMFVRIAAFKIYSAVAQGLITGIQDMAQASSSANATMSALATSSLYLKNSIAAALMPAIQALTPIITQVVDALADFFNMIAMLTARIFNHATTVTIAKRANVDYAATIEKTGDKAKDTTQKIKELQRTVMGFDELNVLDKPTTNSDTPKSSSGSKGMPSPSSMFETVKVPSWINNIGNFTDQIGKIISNWWKGLTNAQKWGAGIGGTAGFIIGGIIGRLIGGPIGQVVGSILGAAAGVAIGVWWAGLTSNEKWSAGIGAGAGALIGGIVGGIIAGPMGVKIGAVFGTVAGGLVGKWWADLTSRQKWGAGIGSGAGALIGGILGALIAGPVGIVVGSLLGGTAGALVGKWWNDLTNPQKWKTGIGATAGAVVGGIIGTILAPGIGTIVGALLGGAVGTAIGNFFDETNKRWVAFFSDIGNKTTVFFTKTIPDIFNGFIKNANVFFTTTLPKWIQSVGDWFNKLPGKIGYALGTALAGIVNFGVKAWKWVTTELPKIILGIINWFAQLPGKIWNWLVSAQTKVLQWCRNLLTTANTEIPKFVKKVSDFISALPGNMLDIGKNIVQGIWNGINGAVDWLHDRISEFCNGIVKGFKDHLQIHSPSRLFRDVIGKNLALGIGLGFIDNMKTVSTSMVKAVPTSFEVSAGFTTPKISDLYSNAAVSQSNFVSNSSNSNPFKSSSEPNLQPIVDSIFELRKAILERPVDLKLYANDRKIAESANRGNASIDRRYHPIAST